MYREEHPKQLPTWYVRGTVTLHTVSLGMLLSLPRGPFDTLQESEWWTPSLRDCASVQHLMYIARSYHKP